MEYFEVRSVDVDPRNCPAQEDSPFITVGLSWVAYLRLFPVSFGGLILITLGMMGAGHWQKPWLVYLSVAVAVAWIVYEAAKIRSVKLFTDESGVWLFKGVFPWQKGFSGARWSDIGSAGCRLGFMSWALRSYRVELENRFTRTKELSVRHLKYGDLAVLHINQILVRLHGARDNF